MSSPHLSGLTASIEERGKTLNNFTAADVKAVEKLPTVFLS